MPGQYYDCFKHIPNIFKDEQSVPWSSERVVYCGFSSNWILPYFPTVRPCVRPCVTGVTSHISHIYKGINAMLIIRGPIKPYIFWIKITLAIFLAKTRPDKTIFSALTNLSIDFDFELSQNINAESALLTLSFFGRCWKYYCPVIAQLSTGAKLSPARQPLRRHQRVRPTKSPKHYRKSYC